MEKKITLVGILTNGIQIGLTNVVSLIGAVILYVLTCWIPYLNIGTTIAMSTLPILMAEGKMFSPTIIFDKKYRESMGDYFITAGLLSMGITAAALFFIIPGMVMSIAWGLTLYFLLDKKLSPIECLRASYKATYGYKWAIWGASFILGVIVLILITIFMKISAGFGVFMAFILFIVLAAVKLGMDAYIYRELSK